MVVIEKAMVQNTMSDMSTTDITERHVGKYVAADAHGIVVASF